MKTNQLTTTIVIEIGHDIEAADAIVSDLKRGGFDARLIPNSRTMKCSGVDSTNATPRSCLNGPGSSDSRPTNPS